VWNHLNPCAHDLRVSVNVAEQQLLDPTFAEQVTAILDWAGLPPAQLTLEITEGIIASHLGDLEVLHRLRALGVTFAIDDFGTGQSSLATIRKLDMVSVLKIDKGFVSGLHRGTTDGAIVEAVVSMAGALGLRTVAEGVEDSTQLQILQDLGVDMLQGYLFNQPLAAQHIQPGDWLQPVGIEVPRRDGVPGLQISRSLMEERRSRSAPRPLRPATARGPGTSGPA
jgi:EAL domain-containing protein (putative c-di-GMP-specific phosphodiesterase class I)